MSFATADLADEHPDAAIALPGLGDFGGRSRFAGPIQTVRCWEDNSLVREALEEPGHGSVLVVDGGASRRCALLGDNLAALAVTNGWNGVIVNGCVRDAAQLRTMELGVRALAASPRKSVKRGVGDRNVRVGFNGVTFPPGAWVYVDQDGILVLSAASP